MPNRRSFNVLVVVRELPISLIFCAAECHTKVVGLIDVRAGAWIIDVLTANANWETSLKGRKRRQRQRYFSASNDWIEALGASSDSRSAILIQESFQVRRDILLIFEIHERDAQARGKQRRPFGGPVDLIDK